MKKKTTKNTKKNHTTTNKPPTDSPNDPRHDRIKKPAELLPHRGANRDRAKVEKHQNAAEYNTEVREPLLVFALVFFFSLSRASAPASAD